MKRIYSSVLVMITILTCFCSTAFAAGTSDTRASLTLSDYGAGATSGSSQGVISISYNVQSSKFADSVGVESIVIYKSNGSHVATITGTTRNGLICDDTNIHAGDYDYKGISGVSYYAEVKVFAEVGSEYDSRTITTGTVKAP